MVGNDLVDLNTADKQVWMRKRFLDKVLQPSEQEQLFRSTDPAKFFWIIWSMKESAYKLHYRRRLKRALNPLDFECFYDADGQGRVAADKSTYQTETIVTEEFVHTVASDVGAEARWISQVVSAKGPNVRKETVDAMIRSFSKVKGLNPRDLQFEKDENGLPFLSQDGEVVNPFCSMSHHGRYGAFTFVKN